MTTTGAPTAAALRAFLARRDLESIRAALVGLPPADFVRAIASPAARDRRHPGRPCCRRGRARLRPFQASPAARDRPPCRAPRAGSSSPTCRAPRADLRRSLPEVEREDIRLLAAHPEDTAGSIMSSARASLSPRLAARQAIEVPRAEAPDRKTPYDAFAPDADRRPIGVVLLRDLLVAPADARVADIMAREVVFVRADDTKSPSPGSSPHMISSPSRSSAAAAPWSASSPSTTPATSPAPRLPAGSPGSAARRPSAGPTSISSAPPS